MEWREEEARREEEAKEKLFQERQDARHAVNVNVSERVVGSLYDNNECRGGGAC